MIAAYSFASPDDRVLGAGAYLAGVAEIGLILAGVIVAGHWLRRAALPGWSGPPALVATATLAIAVAVVLAELLGTVGLFADLPYTLACLLCGLAAWLGLRGRGDGSRAVSLRAPGLPRWAGTITALACALVLAGWAIPTLIALAGGMGRADTLWYHMPLSASFVQTGETGGIHNFDPIFFAGYYPATSEMIHAIGILAFARDFLSPFVNLGFLALALTACWSIGRPFGVAPQALLGGAIALGAEMLVDFQAGEALNDIVGVAFFLCTAAVLVNAQTAAGAGSAERADAVASPPGAGDRGIAIAPAALAVAGVAAGLAASTKLSFVAPVAALTIAIIVIAPRGARIKATAWWTLPMLAAGGFWYLRNLLAIGNPIPLMKFGPLDLPSPERAFELRPGNSIAHYITSLDIWRDWFVPGFDEALGVLWPVGLVLMLGGAAYAVARGPQPIVRALGGVVLFTAIAYVFTPLTAGGEEGEPIAFVWNVRYVAPAMAVGLALLPCLEPLRSSHRRRILTLAGLAIVVVATVASLVEWQVGHTKGAIAMAIGVLGLFGAWTLASRRGLLDRVGAALIAALAVIALLAVGAGFAAQKHFLERRYENLSPQLRLADTARWARDLRDARVGMSGVRGVFNQYPFYGTDLSNEVQWIGEPGPDGAWLRIPDCATWREAINDGGFTHVVTMYDPYNPGELTDTKEGLWTRTDPAAELVMRDGPVAVFAIEGELDPSACGDLPALSAAELDGDSVNNEPLANQPPASFPGVEVPLAPVDGGDDASELGQDPNA